MAKRVKFSDTEMMEKLMQQLSVEDSADGKAAYPFRDWEILHELDRQDHRREYDHSPERITQRKHRLEESLRVRAYLAEHPEIEEKYRGKV